MSKTWERTPVEEQPMTDRRYPLRWHWTEKARPALGDRKGQPCRVLARATPARDPLTGKIARRWNTVLVEFNDGFQTITSGNALRKR